MLGRGRAATGDYDRNANTKALRQLISSGLDAGGEGESIDFLIEHFTSASGASASAEEGAEEGAATAIVDAADVAARQLQASRVWALDQLLVISRSSLQRAKAALSKHRKGGAAATDSATFEAHDAEGAARAAVAPTENTPVELPERALRFFFASAFFELPKKATKLHARFGGCPAVALGPAARRACADRFFSLMGECLSVLSLSGGASANPTTDGELDLLEAVGGWWKEVSPRDNNATDVPGTLRARYGHFTGTLHTLLKRYGRDTDANGHITDAVRVRGRCAVLPAGCRRF